MISSVNLGGPDFHRLGNGPESPLRLSASLGLAAVVYNCVRNGAQFTKPSARSGVPPGRASSMTTHDEVPGTGTQGTYPQSYPQFGLTVDNSSIP